MRVMGGNGSHVDVNCRGLGVGVSGKGVAKEARPGLNFYLIVRSSPLHGNGSLSNEPVAALKAATLVHRAVPDFCPDISDEPAH